MPSLMSWIRTQLLAEKQLDPINYRKKVYSKYKQFIKEVKSDCTYETFSRRVRLADSQLNIVIDPQERINDKRKNEIQYLKKIIAGYEKRTSIEDKLVEVLKDIVIQYKPEHGHVKVNTTSDGIREAVLVCSDWHLDEKVCLNEMFNLNEFDWTIAEKRIHYLFQSAIKIATELNCTDMTILLLGDLISGVIHEDLIYASEIGMTPTIIRTFDLIAKYVVQAAQHFNIKIACVSGNHSRITQHKYFNKAYTFNLEWLMYEFLRHEIENVVDFFYNGSSPFACITIQDYYFLIMHGNMVNAGNNLSNTPAITMSRDAAKINGAIRTKYQQDIRQYNTSLMPPRIDYILTAHFHTDFNLPGFDAVPILGNGCLIGGNAFSLQAIKASGRPMQRFFVVEKDKGVRFQDPIYLDVV